MTRLSPLIGRSRLSDVPVMCHNPFCLQQTKMAMNMMKMTVIFCGCLMVSFFIVCVQSTDSFFGETADELEQCDGDGCESAGTESQQEDINVIITFTNAKSNANLQQKFRLTVSSMLKHASVPLKIQIIGEPESQAIASKILEESSADSKSTYRVR